MTRDEIDELMKENGIVVVGEAVYALVQLVIEREREACARVCDDIMQFYKTNTTMNTDQNLIGYMAAELCGVRIRERGEK